MRLFDVYKNKENKQIIQIECFATHINRGNDKEMLIIYPNIGRGVDGRIGSSPSFNGYGTQGEIEAKYDFLMSVEGLQEYRSWDEVFALVE